MGKALEVIIARAINPGAGPTAYVAGSGDSFAVRNFGSGNTWLENVWAQQATAGFIQIRSPRLHDNVRGLRVRIPAATVRAELADNIRQRLYAQDLLTLEGAGGAAETDTMALLMHYDNVDGLDARLATWDQLAPRVVNILSQEVATTAGATAGDWPAGSAINASSDLLKANTDYAIIGYVTDVACLAVTVRGPDTGNVRVGGPGPAEPIETRDWFVSLSNAIGGPAIPVINSANKAGTIVSVVHTTANQAVNVDLILAELTPGTL